MFGIMGSLFGVLGIFTFGLVFIPIGILCTLFAFFKGQILIGIVSLVVNIFAAILSPAFLTALSLAIGLSVE